MLNGCIEKFDKPTQDGQYPHLVLQSLAYSRILSPFRASVDRSLPVGGAAAASEQLQPVYETKALVAEQSKKIEVIANQLKV